MPDTAILTKRCVALFVTSSLLHAGLVLTVARVREPLLDEAMVLVMLVTTSILGPVLTQCYAPRMRGLAWISPTIPTNIF